jgi:hypothetical protein
MAASCSLESLVSRTGALDSWETFFREKSRRRAAARDYRAYVSLALLTLACAAILIAVIVLAIVGVNKAL